MTDNTLSPICGSAVGLLLAAVIFPIAFGSVGAQSGAASASMMPATQTTVGEARKSLAESFKYRRYFRGLTDAKISRQRAAFTATWFYPDNAQPKEWVYRFADFPSDMVVVRGSLDLSKGYIAKARRSDGRGNHWDAHFWHEAHARMYIAAMATLKEAALAPSTEAADFAAFTAEAQLWLLATPKPPMSDAARTFKVVAEDAYGRKDFSAALDAYKDALNQHPMWPEGHFNAALLAAEAEDFEAAAMHMRRYLVLAPDATDAAAAKDKLLLWEHRARQ